MGSKLKMFVNPWLPLVLKHPVVEYSGSTVDSGGARAPQEFGSSEKGQSLISAYPSLAITTNTPGFKKLSMALIPDN